MISWASLVSVTTAQERSATGERPKQIDMAPQQSPVAVSLALQPFPARPAPWDVHVA